MNYFFEESLIFRAFLFICLFYPQNLSDNYKNQIPGCGKAKKKSVP